MIYPTGYRFDSLKTPNNHESKIFCSLPLQRTSPLVSNGFFNFFNFFFNFFNFFFNFLIFCRLKIFEVLNDCFHIIYNQIVYFQHIKLLLLRFLKKLYICKKKINCIFFNRYYVKLFLFSHILDTHKKSSISNRF
jgi:hypothetical protein